MSNQTHRGPREDGAKKRRFVFIGVVGSVICIVYVLISVERQRAAKEKADRDYYGTK